MIYFLLVCSHVYSGVQCLPLQAMPTARACQFVAKHYRADGARVSGGGGSDEISARCLGVTRR